MVINPRFYIIKIEPLQHNMKSYNIATYNVNTDLSMPLLLQTLAWSKNIMLSHQKNKIGQHKTTIIKQSDKLAMHIFLCSFYNLKGCNLKM